MNKSLSYSLNEQEFLEMASIDYRHTGIEDVILWVGPNPNSVKNRILISNFPNRLDGKDCFILTLPDYKVIGNINREVITDVIIEQIIQWCNKNLQLIMTYSDYEISTGELIERLKPI